MPRSARVLIAALATSAAAVSLLVAPSAHADPALRAIGYAGVELKVPASWPVIDFAATPDACLRTDRPAVYLGTPAAQQQCPAHLVGAADTIWLADAQGTPPSGSARGTLAAPATRDGAIPSRRLGNAEIRATASPDDTSTLDRVLQSARSSTHIKPFIEGTPPPAPSVTDGAAVGPATPKSARTLTPSDPQGVATAGVTAAGRQLTGMAFDTCAAPSTSTMSAWRASPYAAVGIYIGGSMHACKGQSLDAAWVSTVRAQGWGFIPIWVGPQSPCVQQSGLALISRTVSTARAQGSAEAQSAAARARTLGLPAGSVLYYDMENYSMTDSGCSAATIAFLDAWTSEVHRQGFASGAYGGPGSLMRDLSNEVRSGRAFTAPEHIWVAHWNQLQTTQDTYSPQFYPDSMWTNHQRLHQYGGDQAETWGGITIHLDPNWVDAVLPGNPVQTDYGSGIVGPGSPGFVFTGLMGYWRPASGTGAKARAYWTGPNNTSSEANGATWAPTLGTGLYAVDVNVPSASGAAIARYRVSDVRGSRSVDLNQATAAGYRTIEQVLVTGSVQPRVHLSDNAGSSTSLKIWADALRFRKIAGTPLAPTNVAVRRDVSSAVLSWAAAGDGGSPVTSYVVRASNGQSATVSGSARQATLNGLADPSALTYTVSAVNLVGQGPAATATSVVTRLSGPSRFDTSAAISRGAFAPGVKTAYVAQGLDFPDALTGAAVAGRDKSPLLLTLPGSLPASIKTELTRLRPERIVVLGASGAVNDSVVAALRSYSPSVVRVAGAGRYATSAAVSRTSFTATGGTVLLASGSGFPDALSGAPAAARLGAPLLLTDPNTLPAPIKAELTRLRPTRVVMLGSTNAVSAAVATAVKQVTGVTPQRWSGASRWETSAAISRNSGITVPSSSVSIASGADFPDALSLAPVAGTRRGSLLLVAQSSVPPVIGTEVSRLRANRATVAGSPTAVSPSSALSIERLLVP